MRYPDIKTVSILVIVEGRNQLQSFIYTKEEPK